MEMIFEYIENKKYLENLFAEIPAEGTVEVTKICFGREGPHIRIEFLSSIIPDKLPGKYRGQAYNASFFDVELQFSYGSVLSTWEEENIGEFKISIFKRKLEVSIINKSKEKIFECRCDSLILKEVIPLILEDTSPLRKKCKF